MNVLIIDSADLPIPGVSVFSSDADGKTNNTFATIASDAGIAEIPVSDYDYLTFTSIGFNDLTFKNGEVPEIVELSESSEMLNTVVIKPEAEQTAVSWTTIVGIIAAITLIGLGITYLKNKSIKK